MLGHAPLLFRKWSSNHVVRVSPNSIHFINLAVPPHNPHIVTDFHDSGEQLLHINKLKTLLSVKFDMMDMQDLHYFLGISVIRISDDIMISRRHYILNLLFKFGMTKCKLVATPLDRNLKLDADSSTKECESTHYRQLVGSLIYLTITRPDLSYPVGLLSRFMQTPCNTHLDCAKRVLRYVSGTSRVQQPMSIMQQPNNSQSVDRTHSKEQLNE